ncbi:MAG: hypothetical protein U1F08_08190 [Steroidobacteraceae bacterium]
MKKVNLVLAAAIAAAGMTGLATGALYPVPAVAADKAPPGPKVSASVVKPLKAAQEALAAKDYDGALADLKEASAVEGTSAYDQFMIDEMSWVAYLQKKDYPAAATALEQSLNSGFVPAADVPSRLKALTQLNYEAKNYTKATEFGVKYLEAVPGDTRTALMVDHAYYMNKDYAAASALAQKEIAKGGKPDEQMLQIWLQSDIALKNNEGAMQALEARVRWYPQQKYWADLLDNTLPQVRGDRELRDFYRLMQQTNTLSTAEDYSEAAAMMVSGGYPAEAVKVLEAGLAANVFTGDALARAKGDLDRARTTAAADAKDLPGAAKALASAKTGNEMVATGKLYFSAGDYASAADAIQKGLAKGGVADADDANALLGIALVRGGKSAEAKAAFQAVQAPSLVKVTRLWVLYIDATTAAVAAATPAPATTPGGG